MVHKAQTYILMIGFLCAVISVSAGCRRNNNDDDPNLRIRTEARKDDKLILESEDMLRKRTYEVQLECNKLGVSKEERKIRIQAVFDSSEKAIEACRKSGYKISYKPDWGGREDFLRTVLLSDLMPDRTNKEKKEKSIEMSLEKAIKKNEEDLISGLITEKTRAEKDLLAGKIALDEIKKLNSGKN